ncbi:hypothetical protein DQ04_08031000 [Trypanosoma grayi]|uniref:hypothetical protein n=1 Tax=Trypanosoma grayi TaxID=71804 RepID=UPI0004F43566|nr:hypothetical protein DQ04_08031000 [Trypanosoma grayi]KEG08086.1 hypothetical protein DQ04_08031000 [Trypanosoma grayi]
MKGNAEKRVAPRYASFIPQKFLVVEASASGVNATPVLSEPPMREAHTQLMAEVHAMENKALLLREERRRQQSIGHTTLGLCFGGNGTHLSSEKSPTLQEALPFLRGDIGKELA